MSRTSQARGRSPAENDPTGTLARELCLDEKLKLKKAGKCKKCQYFGFPDHIAQELKDTWGKFKPLKKDYKCLLSTIQWQIKCKHRT